MIQLIVDLYKLNVNTNWATSLTQLSALKPVVRNSIIMPINGDISVYYKHDCLAMTLKIVTIRKDFL